MSTMQSYRSVEDVKANGAGNDALNLLFAVLRKYLALEGISLIFIWLVRETAMLVILIRHQVI